jgi:hypothetical protein
MPTAVEFKAEPADVQPPTLDVAQRGLRESRLSVEIDGIASIAPETAAVRAPFERLVVLDVESDRGVAEIALPLQVTVGDRGVQLAGTGYYFDLLIDTSTAPGVISWRLESGGSDARSRLAVLHFLQVLRGGGPLVAKDPDAGVLTMMRVEGEAPDPELDMEQEIYRAVVLVEEWSGYRFVLPQEIGSADLRVLWNVRSTILGRALAVTFTSEVRATVAAEPDWRQADEIRIEEPYSVRLFGADVFLGTLQYRIPVTPVRADPDKSGGLRVTYEPSREPVEVPLSSPRPDSDERASAVVRGAIPLANSAIGNTERQMFAREYLAEIRSELPRDGELRGQIRRRWPRP